MRRVVVFSLLLCFLVSLPLEAKKKSLVTGVYWELNDGTLTISGKGKIPDFQECKTPWYSKRYKIKDIIIEEGITSVGRYAFWFIAGKRLEVDKIRIPKSLEEVCNDAFGFIHASKLVISDSDAFFKMKCQSSIWCNSLYFGSQEITELVIPNGINTINQFICYHTKVSSVLIPNSVKSIGDYAFLGFDYLENITIPNSVTSIGRSAFYSCQRLSSVVIPNSVISIGRSAFTYCENLNTVVIPNSVQTIGESSFYGCRSLTSVVIPTSVNSIGNKAFAYCDILDFVVIPKSLSNIGKDAFPEKTKIYKGELLSLHDNRSDNLFLVNDNGKKGMVRINGKWIIPLDYNYSEIGLLGDKYIKVIQNGNYGLMDLDGKEIIPTSRGYTYISDYDSNKGTFTFTKKGVSGICDAQGREISTTRLAPTADDIKANGGYANAVEMKNGSTKYYKVSKGGRYGLTDSEGKEIVPCEMEALESAGTGYLKYKLNGFWGVMNYTGKIIIDTDRGYTSIGDFKTFNKRFAYTMTGYKGECDASGRQISKIKVDTPQQTIVKQETQQDKKEKEKIIIIEPKPTPQPKPTLQPMTEWVPCSVCGHNPGVCQTCVGMGETASGRRCISCHGTGKCHFCNGQGGRYQTVYR